LPTQPSPKADQTAEEQLVSVSRPKQARSEQTLRRILQAAEELIGEKGLNDVSIPDIVRHAQSSVGGFYARFKGKNELLRALEERFFLRLDEHVQRVCAPDRWRGASLAEVVRGLAGELVKTAGTERNMIAAFLFRAATESEFQEAGLRFRRRVSDRVTDLLMLRSHEIPHPEPKVAIDLCVQIGFALMLQNVIFGVISAGGQTLTDQRLVIEFERIATGYLCLDSRARSSPDAPEPSASG
jgi:AcrR family transcriptional regulator